MNKYNEIVALVHPLFDVFFTEWYTAEIIPKKGNQNLIDLEKKTINGKTLKKQIKTSLGIYGDYLNKQIGKENVCVVIYYPQLHNYEVLKPINKELLLIYKEYIKTLKKFITHYKKVFKNRLYVTNYAPNINKVSSAPILSKHIIKNLNKDVKLKSLGEFYTTRSFNGCVNHWTKFIVQELVANKFTVSKINTIKNRTLSFKTDGLVGFRKANLSATEKRKLQTQKKKKILKEKKKLKLPKRPR